MSRRSLISAVFAVALITASGSPALAAQTQPVRILIVGDSVTQGSSGDWTWRYRLWKHLVASGVQVDFVGPRDDLFDIATEGFGSHEYLDPGFDQDHAARWGMALAAQDHSIGELVRTYRPDVVVEMLGANDLVVNAAPLAQVNEQLTTFVDGARAVDPEIDIVLGELPHIWFAHVSAFNAGLPGLAQSLDVTDSRVIAAETGSGFVELADMYDSAHPTATGELKIAAGFADALAVLGIGSAYPRPLAQIPNGPRQTARLGVRPGDRSAILSWTTSLGATGQYIWIRDKTRHERWTRLVAPVPGTTWTLRGLANFHAYEVRLQAAKGAAISEGLFSNTVAVTPAPPAVSGLKARARRHGLLIRWKPLDSVSGYRVVRWPTGHPHRRTTTNTKRTSIVLSKLVAGRKYQVKVVTLTDGQRGRAARISAVSGGLPVRGPSTLRVVRRSVGTLRLDWSVRKQATRYEVWGKKGTDRWRSLSWTRRASFDSPWSARNVSQAFRVRSWHHQMPGGWSPTRRFPR